MQGDLLGRVHEVEDEGRIVAPDGTAIVPTSKPQPDGTLVKALARAWRWQGLLDQRDHSIRLMEADGVRQSEREDPEGRHATEHTEDAQNQGDLAADAQRRSIRA
jgi:hypothetical protein